MNIEKMREEFEAKFPIPFGIWWSAEGGKDGGRYMTECAHVGCVLHQGRWEGWIASRAAIEVELKPPHTDYDYSDSQVSGACRYYEQAKKAIESLGLKVKS